MSKNARRQICLFGSSANPPTGDGGHVGIVKSISQIANFDEVRVLPVYRHTFVSKRDKLESFHHRISMCRIAFGDINKVTVSDAEKKSFERMAKTLSEGEKEKLRAGTADLLEMLREEEPDADFSFCLGADTFLDLTSFKWKRSREVLQLLEGRLVVLSRRGTNFDIRKLVYKVNELDGMKAMLIEVPTLTDISSSLIRSCAEEEILKQSLQMGVLDYIKENKLYSYASDSVDNEI